MNATPPPVLGKTNGAAAAALLAAGLGCFLLALLAFAGDKLPSIKRALIFYKPSGALSGVTTIGILLWLLIWALLQFRWRHRTVSPGPISAASLLLLALAFLLTFPPIVDLL